MTTWAPEVPSIARYLLDIDEGRADAEACALGLTRWSRTWDDLDQLEQHRYLRWAQRTWDSIQSRRGRRAAA